MSSPALITPKQRGNRVRQALFCALRQFDPAHAPIGRVGRGRMSQSRSMPASICAIDGCSTLAKRSVFIGLQTAIIAEVRQSVRDLEGRTLQGQKLGLKDKTVEHVFHLRDGEVARFDIQDAT